MERRVVSVLFADLVGFTAQAEQSDPEDVQERLSVYHRAAREQVEAHGGRVEKLLGDGVFAVFGVPTAHEDDPERAVRAALRLQEDIEALNQADPELELSVRAAVTTGEVIADLDSDDPDRETIVGDAVNTASRLEGVAPPGGVVVDERTYDASHGVIAFDDLDAVDLKGKSEATSIWLASSTKAVPVFERHAGPFVGRDEELAVVTEALDRTIEAPGVQMLTIVGEPGTGKSRLIHEFEAAVGSEATWRLGRCLPYGEGITFWALGEIVKDEAGILESDSETDADAKLRASVAAVIEDPTQADWVQDKLALLTGTGDESGDIERGELFSAWLRFFDALAERSPLVLVVEDIHWADEALLDFLEQLARRDAAVPILLVAATRPELLADRLDWTGELANATTTTLPPLEHDDAAVLLAALLGRALLPAETQQAILERAGGNPLYVTEFVRLIEQSDALATGTIDELALPDSVQAVIAARLDLLDADERELLQAASVVGKVFWSGAVAALRPREDVAAGLDRLTDRAMIHPVGESSMAGQAEYTFVHALVRDVAYAQIARAERARLHEATADWIETAAGGRSSDVAELLAYHLGEAILLIRKPEPALRDRAYRSLLQAGERTQGLDPVRASDYYHRAADATEDDEDRAHALLWSGRVILSAQADASVEPIEQAHQLYKTAGDPEGQASALSDLAYLKWTSGDIASAMEMSETAVGLIENRPDSEAKARTLMLQVRHLGEIRRFEEAIAAADRARPVVHAEGTAGDQILLQIYRGNALAQIGEEEGHDELVAAMRIADDRNFTHHMLVGRLYLSALLLSALESVRIAREAIRLAEERGLPLQVEWWRALLAQYLALTGDWDESLELCEWVIGEATKHGPSWTTNVVRMIKGSTLFFRGQLADAQAISDGMYEAAKQMGDLRLLMIISAANAAMAQQAGNDEEALRLADEYHGLAVKFQSNENMPFVTAALMNLGEVERIEVLLQDTPEFFGPNAEFQRTQCEGHLAAARGDSATAAELFLEAAEIAERQDIFVGAAIVRVQAAVSLVGDERFEQVAATSRREWEKLGGRFALDMLDEAEGRAAALAAEA